MSNRSKKAKQTNFLKVIGFSALGLLLGCYMLFVVSRSFDPFLGNTFHILVGCILIAVCSLILIITLKNYLFPKKKKRASGVVFLEDELKKNAKKKE